MIIDVHTHIWSSADMLGPEVVTRLAARRQRHWGQHDASPTSHEAQMACVDAALIFGFRSERLGAHVPNELVAAFVARNPHRCLGVAGIDPMRDDALDQLEAAADLGMIGVAVSPACQGFNPTHSSAVRVYEWCVEHRMPLFAVTMQPLTPSAMLQFGRPMLWDEIALSFPDLPIVLNRLGHPWTDEALELIAKHDNVYADIAGVVSRPWQLYNVLLSAASLEVMGKLLFASGFPFDSPARAIESLYTVNALAQGTQLPAIPRSLLRGIVERDSLARLGIASDILPREEALRPTNGEAGTAKRRGALRPASTTRHG